MKVLVVTHHFPPHLSGVGSVAEQQARHLAKNGNEVAVLTSDCSDKAGISKYNGYTLHRLRALNFLETRIAAPFPIFSPFLLLRAYKLVKNADIVHIHDSFYLTSIVTAFWAKVLHKPLFVTQHIAIIPHPSKIVMLIERLAYKTSGAFIFRTSKKIIVLNQRVKDFLLANGVPEAKIVLAVNGVDLSLFYPVSTEQKIKLRQKYDLPVDKTLALFVGRFVPKKGFNKLIKAASENYTLVFVGGERPANVRPNKYMIFLGTFSQRETADVYQACDVFILPSQGEGFPLSIQEAMACGLPIITTDDHGYVTYSFDRSLLCLIHPSVDEIKKHLTKVVKDSKLREAMGEYSYDYAKEHFNWSRTIRAMSNVYSESLN